jgi:valyl-tRNA synthetase
LTGLIDIEAERSKLLKQKEKLEQELSSIQNKLNNEKFISNAKPEVKKMRLTGRQMPLTSRLSVRLNTSTYAGRPRNGTWWMTQ